MKDTALFLFLLVLIGGVGASKRKYPQVWAKYDAAFKALWTALSLLLVGVMGYSIRYLLTQSNAGPETKLLLLLVTAGLILVFLLLNVSLWKKKQ